MRGGVLHQHGAGADRESGRRVRGLRQGDHLSGRAARPPVHGGLRLGPGGDRPHLPRLPVRTLPQQPDHRPGLRRGHHVRWVPHLLHPMCILEVLRYWSSGSSRSITVIKSCEIDPHCYGNCTLWVWGVLPRDFEFEYYGNFALWVWVLRWFRTVGLSFTVISHCGFGFKFYGNFELGVWVWVFR